MAQCLYSGRKRDWMWDLCSYSKAWNRDPASGLVEQSHCYSLAHWVKGPITSFRSNTNQSQTHSNTLAKITGFSGLSHTSLKQTIIQPICKKSFNQEKKAQSLLAITLSYKMFAIAEEWQKWKNPLGFRCKKLADITVWSSFTTQAAFLKIIFLFWKRAAMWDIWRLWNFFEGASILQPVFLLNWQDSS